MNFLLTLFHFLGSVYFALSLIATTALFVITGTFLESATESHRYAASFTYGSPFFIALLLLFFVNILFSALRRWPFQKHHVPFLITHLGLLMLLAGVMSKSIWGTQGSMGLLEGSSNRKIFLANSYVVHIEKRLLDARTKISREIPLKIDQKGPLASPFPELKITLLESLPHVSERFETWIKENHLNIRGQPPFPVHDWSREDRHLQLPLSGQAALYPPPSPSWEVMAFRSDDVLDLARQAYLQGLQLVLIDRHSNQTILEMPLKEYIDKPFTFSKGEISFDLHWNVLPLEGFQSPSLQVKFSFHQLPEINLKIPLDGPESLLDTSSFPIAIEFKRTPRLVFIQNPQYDDFLLAFDAHGRIHSELFRSETLSSVIAYDRGFGGYSIPATLPFVPYVYGRQEQEREQKLRAHGIYPDLKPKAAAFTPLTLETPLTLSYKPLAPKKKLEDNLPKIKLKIETNNESEIIELAYDRFGTGIKWPLLHGQYLLRFQPHFQKIPYQIRLRDARQINYPHSSQPFSYESDLLITDLHQPGAQPTEATLSMNHVYQTWDGYRFYLANISPGNETAAQRVQLIVNHDPAKYFLTYPGGIVLATGILTLFWLQPYRKQKKKERGMRNEERVMASVATNPLIHKSLLVPRSSFLVPSIAFCLLTAFFLSTPQPVPVAYEGRFHPIEISEIADEELHLLPGRYRPGEWFPLKALGVSSKNFTLYDDALFQEIRTTYLELATKNNQEKEFSPLLEKFAKLLQKGYQPLAGTAYQQVANNALYYPSTLQLKAELFYYRFPLTEGTLVSYALAFFAFVFAWTLKAPRLHTGGMALLLLGFGLHTSLLAIRCFILERPPVSNMFETVIYVPWVAVGLSLGLYFLGGLHRFLLAGSTFLAFVLLLLLQVTELDQGLQNVQAVLNSQYWLLIHVLMVVGSYGAFLLGGVLGHIYLIRAVRTRSEELASLSQAILQTIYIGTALLITGTILGGVWAAESWGRFWDWDPKESWAFISSCVYLLIIHAYRFQYIQSFGLAVGSIVGLLAISFTWYGVNYILGTGLHSYGFGSGGEIGYFLFLLSELGFIMTFFYWHYRFVLLKRKKEIC